MNLAVEEQQQTDEAGMCSSRWTAVGDDVSKVSRGQITLELDGTSRRSLAFIPAIYNASWSICSAHLANEDAVTLIY